MADIMTPNWLSLDRDSFIIWFRQSYSENNGLGVHCEFPWSQCRKEFDAPPRIYLHLIWGSVSIAMRREGKTQAWNHKDGNLYEWRWVSWHPNRSIQCRAKYVADKGGVFSNGPREWECSRLRWHRGNHA